VQGPGLDLQHHTHRKKLQEDVTIPRAGSKAQSPHFITMWAVLHPQGAQPSPRPQGPAPGYLRQTSTQALPNIHDGTCQP
jgi:hypothetical protein